MFGAGYLLAGSSAQLGTTPRWGPSPGLGFPQHGGLRAASQFTRGPRAPKASIPACEVEAVSPLPHSVGLNKPQGSPHSTSRLGGGGDILEQVPLSLLFFLVQLVLTLPGSAPSLALPGTSGFLQTQVLQVAPTQTAFSGAPWERQQIREAFPVLVG